MSPVINTNDLPGAKPIEGYTAKFVHTQNMSFAHWTIEAGARLPEHSHPHEQVANVIAGEFEITIDGKTEILRPGSVAVIPSNALHSGVALTDCKIIDAFFPVREDYVKRFSEEPQRQSPESSG